MRVKSLSNALIFKGIAGVAWVYLCVFNSPVFQRVKLETLKLWSKLQPSLPCRIKQGKNRLVWREGGREESERRYSLLLSLSHFISINRQTLGS